MSDRSRLLIVDDDRAITSTVGPLLRDLADVDTAHSVAEALEKLASHTYAACVLDLVLGDDPASLHDALSSREVPTLLISGRDHAAIGPTAEVRGWSYAAKPLSPAVLRGLVAELLGLDAPEPTQRGRMTPAPRPGGAPKPVDAASAPMPAPLVQALDKLVDIVAILAVAYLGVAGKLSGELAGGIIAAIAGVGTVGRAITGRQVGAASAAVALAAFLTAAPSTTAASSSTRTGAPHVTPPAILGALVLLVLGLSGCAGASVASGAAAAVQSTLTVIRDVRSLVCTSKLDPLFGNPREGEDTYAPIRRDAGSDTADASTDAP
jgi:CheY-like chemotaxis protein